MGRFEELAFHNVETFLVAAPFSLEERFEIIEMPGREAVPRSGWFSLTPPRALCPEIPPFPDRRGGRLFPHP